MTLSRYAIKERLPSLRRQIAKECGTSVAFLDHVFHAHMGRIHVGSRQPLTVSEVRAIEYQWLLDYRSKRREHVDKNENCEHIQPDMSFRSTG